MHFLQWLRDSARWDTIAWLVLIVAGSVLEITGVTDKHTTTFTDLVESILPLWARFMLLALLGWHFVFSHFVGK